MAMSRRVDELMDKAEIRRVYREMLRTHVIRGEHRESSERGGRGLDPIAQMVLIGAGVTFCFIVSVPFLMLIMALVKWINGG
jgi:hypothetical protein